jgi:hypothetical protein
MMSIVIGIVAPKVGIQVDYGNSKLFPSILDVIFIKINLMLQSACYLLLSGLVLR